MYFRRHFFCAFDDMGFEHFLYGKMGEKESMTKMPFFIQRLSRRIIFLAALDPISDLLCNLHYDNFLFHTK